MKNPNPYPLFLLAAIFAIAQLDRHILGISLNAIGKEFVLSDTQLGLLSGLIFALVFVLAGFPIASLAAHGNRRNIVAVSAVIWSALTLATAAAQNFAHLIVARLGVGIGEAGAVSPAHSMISDIYPPEKRTSAMASFVVGANIGILLAFLIGGIIGNALGWRWAFIIASVPGFVLALLLRFTIAEPKREVSPISRDANRSLFFATAHAIWQDKSLVHAVLGLALTGIVTFGALAWNPSFIIRVHGFNQAQTGIFLAITIGIVGGFGTWLSGWIADRMGKRDPRWRIGVIVIAIIAAKPFAIGFLTIKDPKLALGCFVFSAFMAGVFWGPTFAHLHSRIAPFMRPMGTAIFIFMFNLIGVGVGPTLVGIASEYVFSEYGQRSLAYALLIMQFAGLWGAWHYWRVTQFMTEKIPSPVAADG